MGTKDIDETPRRPRRRLGWWLALAVGAALGTGCNQSDFGDGVPSAVDDGGGGGDDDDDDGPGSNARDPDEDVSCESEDDCGMGETCVDSVCQMARCKDGPYVSDAPLKSGLKFYVDREFVVADSMPSEGAYYVDGYAPEPGSIDYPGSWEMSENPIIDVAGGDFLAEDVEMFVAAVTGSNELVLGGTDQSIRIGVGFEPTSIAAGDMDRDGKDEVVVLGQFGNAAYCHIDEQECNTFNFQNGNGRDVAVADVEGDGYAEAVFLLENGGGTLLYVWQSPENVDELGDDDYQGETGHDIMRIDAGDIDGDTLPEIVGIQDDGWIDSARMYVFSVSDGAVAELDGRDSDDTSRDISLGDIDMDQVDEILVLREGGVVEYLETGEGGIQPVMTHQLQVSVDPLAISATDFDGDSPRTKLKNPGGDLLPGPVVPTMVVHFPPYDSERSDGEPRAFVGESDIQGESHTQYVSLRSSIDLGVSGSLFGIFSGGLSTRISNEVGMSYTEDTTYYIGTRVSAGPSPKDAGYDYGLVMLNCSCFHAYYYEIEDPRERLGPGGDGEEFVMLLPVGGTTTVWSSKRYNAMAEAVGTLPHVEIPYVIGDLSSYPSGPQRADGSPIEEEDFVFPEVPNLLVSDAGNIGWWLSVNETMTNETSMTSGLEIRGELGLGPFKFGAGLGGNWGEAHSIRVGEAGLFGGTVPPVPDDPDTPEDEYLEYAYSFAPYVYREHYTDADGDDAAYYVMSFAVGLDPE